MIEIKKKYVVFWMAGILVALFLYLSTLWNFLQAMADAITVSGMLGWAIVAWVFHKVAVLWSKMFLASFVWEQN